MKENAVVINIKSDDTGRYIHICDIYNQTSFTYLDDHKCGLISATYPNEVTKWITNDNSLEIGYGIYTIEEVFDPGSSNIVIQCKEYSEIYDDPSTGDVITYKVYSAKESYQYFEAFSEETVASK